MNERRVASQATQIRSTIKSIVAQLDRWDQDQVQLARRRVASINAAGGREERQHLSRVRAQQVLGTTGLPEPPCEYCGEAYPCTHLLNEPTPRPLRTQTEEEVSTGVHRGIVHRLFAKSRELYKLSYPRFYPGPTGSDRDVPEVFPVPLTGPDYQRIAIRRAARQLSTLSPPSSSFDRARVSSVLYQFYSEAFSLSFEEFQHETLTYLSANFSEQYGTSIFQYGQPGSESDQE